MWSYKLTEYYSNSLKCYNNKLFRFMYQKENFQDTSKFFNPPSLLSQKSIIYNFRFTKCI